MDLREEINKITNYLNNIIKYQDIYIRFLEGKIMQSVDKDERKSMRYELDLEKDIISELDICLEKDIGIPLEFNSRYPYAPEEYILRKVSGISFNRGNYHDSVILKWKNGEKEMGHSLYLNKNITLDLPMIACLVEKFFYDVYNLKVEELKKDKDNGKT